MTRRLQLGVLILGMALVAAERLTASASPLTPTGTEGILAEGFPTPPPN
jgi:hypothetical protein